MVFGDLLNSAFWLLASSIWAMRPFLFLSVSLFQMLTGLFKTNSRFKFIAGLCFLMPVLVILGHASINDLMEHYPNAMLTYLTLGMGLGILRKDFQHEG